MSRTETIEPNRFRQGVHVVHVADASHRPRVLAHPLLPVERIDRRHILVVQRQVRRREIVAHMFRIGGLGDHRKAMREMPGQHHLRRRLRMLVRDAYDRRVLQQVAALPQRAPALRHDAMRLVIRPLFQPLVPRVKLDLVEHRRHARRIDDRVEMLREKVRHADRSRLARVTQAHQRLPRLDILPLPRRGPVDQVQIDRIHAQQRQTLVQRRLGIALPVVPQLGRDEGIAARQPFADAAFVAIDRCGVDQPISDIERAAHHQRGLCIGQFPGAEAQLGHGPAIVQRQIGHRRTASQ
ncbi:hypothetical protein WR25_16419 [Diploscapter pachys]|uniref:Uncharacterized protein n=1 Tax=Diploscapter pachys TaxID=2018661 RepID=A0A2A2K6Y3_9BILA|nr:hypothetical protein WR25_16419 [Diploscapter pachys]